MKNYMDMGMSTWTRVHANANVCEWHACKVRSLLRTGIKWRRCDQHVVEAVERTEHAPLRLGQYDE